MEIINFLLHFEQHLRAFIQNYGVWAYALLFAIIFCETGLVITPFLPGDSLLFAAGALAADGSLNIILLSFLLVIAAILGDTVNYWIGYLIGPRVFNEQVRFLKREYLVKTHEFYEKHGGKTIILARFIPIIRTFAPFVAGVGKMTYIRFISYNVIGGLLWVGLFVFAGYFFGNIPFVQKNFSLVIVAIIILSVLPAVYEYFQHRKEAQKAQKAEKA